MRKIHTLTPFTYMRERNPKSKFLKMAKAIIFNLENILQNYKQKFPGRKGNNDLSPKNIQSRFKNSERV